MTTRTSGTTRGLALATWLVGVGLVSGQPGVPLPPIGGAPPAARTAPAADPVPVLPEPLPGREKGDPKDRPPTPPARPRADRDKQASRERLEPPQLGQSMSPGALVGKPGGAAVVTLPDVVHSISRHYPQLRAVEQERVLAAAAVITARGVFDVNLRSQEHWVGDTFDYQRYHLNVEQQTPFYGLSYFAGYRLGSGRYPVYYDWMKTAEGGELRAGVSVPLLRGLAIDRARATLARARIDQAIAEPSIHQQRIDIARAGALTFWTWVAAGQRLLIATDVLRIAEERNEALGKRVQAGALARIEQEDNRRVIIERRARLVGSQRAFEQASIQLSLYLRDEGGCPIIPAKEQLPAFNEPPPPPDKAQRQADLEAALLRRPELQQLALQRQRVLIELDLAKNQMLPGLNVVAQGAQDVGAITKKDLFRSYGEVSLSMDVPLQQREARGRILAARAELERIAAREQMQRDRVQVEVQNALNGLDLAYEMLRRGKDNRLQTTYLEEAERRQFDIGKSDLFRVNIRELNTAEARMLEIDAVAEFFRSLADYKAALGLDPTRLH